ncbi:GNAT family N-acetyltransferase [Inhella proteolytica]|uniref:GNAT family N-acetyltransferase n=1 Tax=Inhella proteolytica TaxID=2795029 RepID=A0A931J603_9BURK|nr:GNAT family N-acetyltransferase [Inhella proteolytica]MBH9578458.1 GNAT family N-acetyltransferase [Inhella proteolytica]
MQILDTERLRLRWFRPEDAGFLLGLINEPAWIAGIRDSGVRTEEAARDWMQGRLLDPYWRLGHGFWMVERKADGEPLGMCGIFKRDTLPLPDLGYGLRAIHAGQGYAREAARACLDYARRVLGRDELLAITSPTNEASNRLLRDLGFAEEGVTEGGPDGPTLNWRWCATPRAATDAQAQIDALVRRFFAAFDNRQGAIAPVAALPALFLPEALVTAPGQAPCSVREFVEPRALLVQGGRLREFHEWELAHQTVVDGSNARRELRYAKQGLLDGQPYGGQGSKQLDLAQDGEGRWRIASLSWKDD